MNLQQLQYLVATADAGTMTKAAACCHVAQPVVSRALRSLERELGLVLLSRHGRGIELTCDGREVVQTARRALAEVTSIQQLTRSRARKSGQVVTVATTPTLEAELGAGLAPTFWKRHPTYALRFVRCDSRQEVAGAVLDGQADVGLCDLPVPEDLNIVLLDDREVVLIAPPGSTLPDPLPIEKLAELSLILPTRGSERRAAFEGMFAQLGISPTVAFESDERAAWISAVLAGHGSCLWYRHQGDDAARRGATVRAFLPRLRLPIGVVHTGGLRPPAAAFVKIAEEAGGAAT